MTTLRSSGWFGSCVVKSRAAWRGGSTDWAASMVATRQAVLERVKRRAAVTGRQICSCLTIACEREPSRALPRRSSESMTRMVGAGEPRVVSTLNFSFMGNPGTGKTTAAKLFGTMLHELGVAFKPNGSIIELGVLAGRAWATKMGRIEILSEHNRKDGIPPYGTLEWSQFEHSKLHCLTLVLRDQAVTKKITKQLEKQVSE